MSTETIVIQKISIPGYNTYSEMFNIENTVSNDSVNNELEENKKIAAKILNSNNIYEMLDLEPSYADLKTITKAYRRVVKKVHTDHNQFEKAQEASSKLIGEYAKFKTDPHKYRSSHYSPPLMTNAYQKHEISATKYKSSNYDNDEHDIFINKPNLNGRYSSYAQRSTQPFTSNTENQGNKPKKVFLSKNNE